MFFFLVNWVLYIFVVVHRIYISLVDGPLPPVGVKDVYCVCAHQWIFLVNGVSEPSVCVCPQYCVNKSAYTGFGHA